jgi:hypothetical protein
VTPRFGPFIRQIARPASTTANEASIRPVPSPIRTRSEHAATEASARTEAGSEDRGARGREDASARAWLVVARLRYCINRAGDQYAIEMLGLVLMDHEPR